MGRKKGDNCIGELERAFDLVVLLQTGNRLTASMIAERYSVSLRTGQRLLLAAEISLPVRSIGGGGMGQRQLIWAGLNPYQGYEQIEDNCHGAN